MPPLDPVALFRHACSGIASSLYFEDIQSRRKHYTWPTALVDTVGNATTRVDPQSRALDISYKVG